MNYRSFAVLTIVVAGCSSSPMKNDGESERGILTDTQTAGPNHWRSVDFARPLFIQASPGARCSFRGADGATSAEVIDADAAGKVHFFPPPQSWGARLDVECAAGATTTHVAIDLDDASTYQVDTELGKKAAPSSIRPALTGNLEAIPTTELLHKGYPPRPDAKRDPERYKRWVDIVSAPRVVRDLKKVKALGHQAGNYVARVTNTETDSNSWAGRVFDANGWTSSSYANLPITPNENDTTTWYVQYDTYMSVPPWIRCARNDNCYGSAWSGMGGMEALGGVMDGSLIQSGVYFTNVNGTISQYLFVEYAPDAPWIFLPAEGFSLSANDTIETWGWTASDWECSDYSASSTPTACFGFYNVTTGEYASPTGAYDLSPPSGSIYYGWTFESIIENQKRIGGGLADFGTVYFAESALAADNNYRGPSTDPWIYLDASDTSPTSLIAHANGTTDDPWDYEVDWVSYR